MIEKTEVVREDNLLMAIEGITDEEGNFLETKEGLISSRTFAK